VTTFRTLKCTDFFSFFLFFFFSSFLLFKKSFFHFLACTSPLHRCFNLHTSVRTGGNLKIDAHTQKRGTAGHYVWDMVVGDRIITTRLFTSGDQTFPTGTFGIVKSRLADKMEILFEKPSKTTQLEETMTGDQSRKMLVAKKEYYPKGVLDTVSGWKGYISRRSSNVGGRGDRTYVTTCLATPRVMKLLTFVMGDEAKCTLKLPFPKLPYNQDTSVYHVVPYYVKDASVDYNQIANAEKDGTLPQPYGGMSSKQDDLSETVKALFTLKDPVEQQRRGCKAGKCTRDCQGAPLHGDGKLKWWCWSGYEGVNRKCTRDADCPFSMPCTSGCGA
jgi:hypothetical protein